MRPEIVDGIAKLFNIAPDMVVSIYWIGCIVAAIVTLFGLLFNHYRDYYHKLKTFIEKDGGRIPSREIDGGGVVGGGFLVVVIGFLWPAVVGLGACWFSCVGVVNLCKWIVNLPGDLVEKTIVKEQRNKMLTSPNEDVRWLAEKHSRKNKSNDN